MGRDRNIRRSVLERVKTILQAPPDGSSPYAVYDERQMRQVANKQLVPVARRAFLLDAYLRPAEPALPMVVVETSVQKRSFELGNREGRLTTARLNVFGRLRGERDDLGSLLADHLGAAIPIYTFTSSGSSLAEQAVVRDLIELENVARVERLAQEGSLDLWQVVTFAFETRH